MRLVPIAFSLCASLLSTSVLGEPIEAPRRPITPPRSVISPKAPKLPPLAIGDLFKASRTMSAAWSADGKAIVYTSDESGRSNVYVRSLERGATRMLTNSQTNKSGLALTADGTSVLFNADNVGRELNDIFLVPIGGGEEINLTQTEDVNEFGPVVAANGAFAAIGIRGKNEASTNVAVLDLKTRAVRRLTDEKTPGVQIFPVAVSADSRFVLANRFDWSFTLGEVVLIDVTSGQTTRLTPEGQYSDAGGISPDGKTVSAAIEDARGIQQAVTIDVATLRTKPIMASEWEQKAGWFSPDGKRTIIVTNVDGREEIFLHTLATGRNTRLSVPPGVNRFPGYTTLQPVFSNAGDKLLFSHTSSREPLDWWSYDIAKKAARRLTDLGGVDTRGRPSAQLVHYPSADGTVISAYLWMPANLPRNGLASAVLTPHGGPTAQKLDMFDQVALGLVSRGYVVLSPNFRGSTGYGRSFRDANRKDLGGGDLDDVVAGAKFLADTGYVDAKKIGITGGSYGGYMTFMALAKTPDVWAAGVGLFGIVNWRTMWDKGAPQNRRYLEGLVGDPAKDPAAFDRASPFTYLKQVRAPLLVLHGENDIRVPIGEARQLVETLRADGKTVDANIYANEGHGFGKRANQIDALERTLRWFETYLPTK